LALGSALGDEAGAVWVISLLTLFSLTVFFVSFRLPDPAEGPAVPRPTANASHSKVAPA
jgi:hypothetical protein